MKIFNDKELDARFDWQDVVVLVACAFVLGVVFTLAVVGTL